jgi:rhodanese-related sulfurtransferase
LGKDLFRQGEHLARLIVAVILMTTLLSGQNALAEESTQFSPVPQSLLFKFLVDNEIFALVDARSPAEFDTSHVNGAINVPHDSPDDTLSLLPSDPDAPIIVYCKTGKRAKELKTRLVDRGYTNVRVLLPEQIFWFDDMAVFNCSGSAAGPSKDTITSSIVDKNREGEL